MGTMPLYMSPFRNEHTASFKVDFKSNLWYDFGVSQGGSLINLVMRLNQCSFAQAIERIENGDHKSIGVSTPQYQDVAVTKSGIEVIGSCKLQHPSLTKYLRDRSIDVDIATEYCREVYYKFGNRHYFAIGFPNVSYGYALRNPYFKGCLPPANVSYISKGTDSLNLFEGFMDFLSLITMKPKEGQTSSLVLNSISNIKKSKKILSKYSQIDSYLDNDNGGRQTMEQLRQEQFPIVDCSTLFAGYKDLNEFLCAQNVLQKPSITKQKHGIKR